MTYVDGFIVPVAPGKKEDYRKLAADLAPLFQEFGALGIVECLEDDVKDGKVTDFRRAVAAEPGEHIVFSWVVWPSKEVRDAANKKMMEDPRMQPKGEVPFNMQRLVMGGFRPIVQVGEASLIAQAEPEREPA